jgi:signal transduction histidine kinase
MLHVLRSEWSGYTQVSDRLVAAHRELLLTLFISNPYSLRLCSGEGDLHDDKFDRYRRSVLLTEGLFSSSSVSYTLTLYPNDELFDVFSTHNPDVATAGSVCIIIFTSLLFILYDFFVRQEFNVKRSVLEAKRNFVRFISHEVRTPLNAVCMGLQLMQEEIRESQSNATARKRYTTESDKKADMLELTEEILGSATSAVGVLNDLLNYDKVEMGTLRLERSIVPIWDLIERIFAEFKLPAKAKKIDFKLDFSELAETDEESPSTIDLPQDISERRVFGDAIRIAQVLRNVVSNGLKFTPDGGEFRRLAPHGCVALVSSF